jgi:hypothetical protein
MALYYVLPKEVCMIVKAKVAGMKKDGVIGYLKIFKIQLQELRIIINT